MRPHALFHGAEGITTSFQIRKQNQIAEKGVNLNIDLKGPQLYFDKLEELKNADETVKKILSLEYATRV